MSTSPVITVLTTIKHYRCKLNDNDVVLPRSAAPDEAGATTLLTDLHAAIARTGAPTFTIISIVQMVGERLVNADKKRREQHVEAIRGHAAWITASVPDFAKLDAHLSPADMEWWQRYRELDVVVDADHVRADELIAQLLPSR